ncbi:MAG: class A beta-lactamase [Alphaproteobacteria bacterium]|uniref:class A beta-lactamase n=1 Tax=Brevundimonas sp. TaxID=1871086 RepID=UPI0017EED2AC|nr:class A beta-lactamase [Brevundimonas sp.]MBA3048477.1 class A beta-lactamase [Brevundimonas sp.]MBU3971623.1 class A beta-lactamase [Alphaproteobacteria bacterium]MBU4039185.1 class A beta-lactamase [Alphaproteobacteria bacterium]
MTRTDRRSVLTGFGALALGGCGRAEPQATPEAPVAPAALDLSGLERANGGRLGFVAHDAGSGRRLAWRGDERFVYCSTFKMYLAAATFLRVQAGQERLDRQIPVAAADMVNHAPVTGPAVGGALSVETLMKGAVEVSDNPAANLLLRALGGLESMRAFYRSLGDDSTTVDRFEPEMNRLDGDKDTIVPLRSVANLKRLLIDADTPLSEDHKARLLRWMTDTPTGQGRIKAGLPAGWTVAHKTGTGGYGPTNDIGVLYPPAGAPVIVAAYYHAAAAGPADRHDAVIAEATRLALAALGRA